MMERLKRFKRRMKNYEDDPQEMSKFYETLQHGKSEEMDLLGPKERLMMEQVKEGDTEELQLHLEVIYLFVA